MSKNDTNDTKLKTNKHAIYLFTPISIFALVMICAMAVSSGYRVSINWQDGFQFEPAKIQSMAVR